MAQLTVRGLDEGLVKQLKIRAAHNGRSAEAEHRMILETVLGAPPADELRAVLEDMPEVDDDVFRGDRSSRPIEFP
ncbi:MAG: DNA-binding protein [Myxococcota bacterium]